MGGEAAFYSGPFRLPKEQKHPHVPVLTLPVCLPVCLT